MAVSLFTLDGQITGQASGPKPVRFTYNSSVGVVDQITVSAGSNAYTFASGNTGVMLIPATNSTVALTLKGVTGDTGVALNVSNPTILALSATVTSLCISAGAAADIQVIRF